MNEYEEVLEGWEQIAKVLGVTAGTVRKRRQELLDNNVVFIKMKIINKPPPRMVYCTWPSTLKNYILNKGWF